MAKKKQSVFVCQECGSEHSQWLGKCQVCGTWGSLVEEVIRNDKDSRSLGAASKTKNKVEKLKDVGMSSYQRIDTGIEELNRVLGGGIVKGSMILISGEPGIGKSTMIIQSAANIGSSVGKVLYVSGEESEEQIKLRADRVCNEIPNDLYVVSETNIEAVVSMCDALEPEFLVIDSIQTMYTESIESAPGSVSQARACGNILMKLAKTRGIAMFIVAHVTKSGELAGPKIVEHLVDCVLNFTGERDQEIRILRSFKNRFGTTSEIGAFSMEQEGLVEIKDLAASFVDKESKAQEGSIITAIYEGSRAVFLEVQALTSNANVGFARRTAVGIDNQRLNMILAVLEKKAGLNLINQDVFVNVVGGMKPDSTAVDLAVAMAIYSSLKGKVPKDNLMVIGEIGLTGELKPVKNADKIIGEAKRLGYNNIILPEKNYINIKNNVNKDNSQLVGVRNILDGLKSLT